MLLDYSAVDISDCFAEIHTRGVSVFRDGVELTERCQSPLAFLSKAINEVLRQIQIKRSKTREQAEQQMRSENEAREAAEWTKKEKAFLRAFPGDDRQHEALSELCRNLPF